MSFCAICLRSYDGDRREPLGRDDALVAVCNRCVTEGVDETSFRDEPASVTYTARTARVRAHRAVLARLGLCIYGAQHGAATSGKLCADCRARERGRRV